MLNKLNKFLYWFASLTTPENAYNLCHFLIGLLSVLVIGRCFDCIGYTFFSVIILAAIKEFWFDSNYEIATIAGSDLMDFIGYGIGALCGLWLALRMP